MPHPNVNPFDSNLPGDLAIDVYKVGRGEKPTGPCNAAAYFCKTCGARLTPRGALRVINSGHKCGGVDVEVR